MSDLTLKEFIEVVQRSQLVSDDPLAAALEQTQLNSARDSAVGLADLLVQQDLLTPWQRKNLLKGKSRGFFLGGYRLMGLLGAGGMSSVFLAQHPMIDRQVAIKILPASRSNDQAYVDRFLREAQAIAKLGHPNVVRVFDVDQEGDTHFMVMEYVSGHDLKVIVKRDGPLDLQMASHYVAQASAGLQHAHDRGLVHRDIKPANLLVTADDVVKILDLGLARLEDDELASLTVVRSETMMGTADYLAPEQARNAHTVDHRADIYSLGCTFYFLLTGHAPFTTGTIAERILAHQTVMPSDVRAERPDCPHALADVCMTMLAKDPEDRFESAGQVAKRLHRWLITQGFANSTATYAGIDEQQPMRLQSLATAQSSAQSSATDSSGERQMSSSSAVSETIAEIEADIDLVRHDGSRQVETTPVVAEVTQPTVTHSVARTPAFVRQMKRIPIVLWGVLGLLLVVLSILLWMVTTG